MGEKANEYPGKAVVTTISESLVCMWVIGNEMLLVSFDCDKIAVELFSVVRCSAAALSTISDKFIKNEERRRRESAVIGIRIEWSWVFF